MKERDIERGLITSKLLLHVQKEVVFASDFDNPKRKKVYRKRGEPILLTSTATQSQISMLRRLCCVFVGARRVFYIISLLNREKLLQTSVIDGE